MNKFNHIENTLLLALGMAITGTAFAGTASIPNTFTSGTAAVASEVNGNFTSVKTAVDDNDSRITSLEGNDTTQQASVDDHETRVTSLEGNDTTQQASVDDHETRVTSLEGNDTTQQASVDDHETRIADIETGAISIPPSAFVSNGTGDCRYRISTSKNFGSFELAGPGNCQLAAPLYLPHGRTMTSLTCYLLDNEAPSDFDMVLNRHNMTDPSSTANAETIYSLTTNFQQDPAVIAKTDSTPGGSPGSDIIDNNTYHYQLRVSVDSVFTGGDSLSMYGCKVNYQ